MSATVNEKNAVIVGKVALSKPVQKPQQKLGGDRRDPRGKRPEKTLGGNSQMLSEIQHLRGQLKSAEERAKAGAAIASVARDFIEEMESYGLESQPAQFFLGKLKAALNSKQTP